MYCLIWRSEPSDDFRHRKLDWYPSEELHTTWHDTQQGDRGAYEHVIKLTKIICLHNFFHSIGRKFFKSIMKLKLFGMWVIDTWIDYQQEWK